MVSSTLSHCLTGSLHYYWWTQRTKCWSAYHWFVAGFVRLQQCIE